MPLGVEELESRCLLSIVAPTAIEQLLLQELNAARANPAAYGQSIGLDLSNVAPSQPLAFDPRLIDAARNHSIDMAVQRYFDHVTPEGVDPGERISADGFTWQSWGESIGAGPSFSNPADLLSALIIDNGVSDLGHRRQLLSIDATFQSQNAVGIGVVLNSTGPLTNYYTIDTAQAVSSLPYITGVVLNDANHNGAYDIGEGMGNVTITVAGVGSVTTWDSGGYSFQVPPGTYQVTASGGSLAAPVTQVVEVGGQNVQVNFFGTPKSTAPDPFVPKIYQTVLGRAPSTQDLAFWNAVLQTGVSHAQVASAIENSPESFGRKITGWYQTYLARTPGAQEISWWSNQLGNGATEESVIATILASPEYMQHSQSVVTTSSTGQQAFIANLYSQVLNRQANPTDMSYWLAQLVVSPRSTVAQEIVGSTEARSIVVTGYYQSILGRKSAPTPAEVSFWATSPLLLEDIRLQFETSAEYLS